MSKLIVYIQDGTTKTIGTNPKLNISEIKEIAKKLVPIKVEYEIVEEKEYKQRQSFIDEQKKQKLVYENELNKEKLRREYIDKQIQSQLNNNIGL